MCTKCINTNKDLSQGIHPPFETDYKRGLMAAGSWNFDPLTDEQIEKARIDFVRGCAEEKHAVNISASWRPGTAAISEAKHSAEKDAKISEALNEAIQAPMDQAALSAAVEMMKIEINDGKVKVPVLEDHSNLFKKPGVDETAEVIMEFTPFITAAMLRDKKVEMADCKLNGVMVKDMTLAEFQAVWAQQIKVQEQREAQTSVTIEAGESFLAGVYQIIGDNEINSPTSMREERLAAINKDRAERLKNPCAEIALDELEPTVLTSTSAEKQRIEENIAKLKASQALNASERIELDQHLVGLRASLAIRERDNRLANEARHARYEEFMAAQNRERKEDLRQRQIIVDEIENLAATMTKSEPDESQKVWVDIEVGDVILEGVTLNFDQDHQSQDRIHRHVKQPCPECSGSGEYIGFNHTEICPCCKGSKVV